MNAKETVDYLWGHGRTMSTEHKVTILGEIATLNAQLKAKDKALEEIRDIDCCGIDCETYNCTCSTQMQDIAKAALNPKT